MHLFVLKLLIFLLSFILFLGINKRNKNIYIKTKDINGFFLKKILVFPLLNVFRFQIHYLSLNILFIRENKLYCLIIKLI